MARGHIKIGTTTRHPEVRLAQLQTGNPNHLQLMAFIYGWTAVEERMLHRQFSYCRVRGEWFAPTPDLLAYIESARRGTALLPSRSWFGSQLMSTIAGSLVVAVLGLGGVCCVTGLLGFFLKRHGVVSAETEAVARRHVAAARSALVSGDIEAAARSAEEAARLAPALPEVRLVVHRTEKRRGFLRGTPTGRVWVDLDGTQDKGVYVRKTPVLNHEFLTWLLDGNAGVPREHWPRGILTDINTAPAHHVRIEDAAAFASARGERLLTADEYRIVRLVLPTVQEPIGGIFASGFHTVREPP